MLISNAWTLDVEKDVSGRNILYMLQASLLGLNRYSKKNIKCIFSQVSLPRKIHLLLLCYALNMKSHAQVWLALLANVSSYWLQGQLFLDYKYFLDLSNFFFFCYFLFQSGFFFLLFSFLIRKKIPNGIFCSFVKIKEIVMEPCVWNIQHLQIKI